MGNDKAVNRPGEAPSSTPEIRKDVEQRDLKEVREATDVGRGAYVEAIGMDESVEASGRVSEVLSEGGEIKGDAKGTTVQAEATESLSSDEIKARLLQNAPSENAMRAQIEKEIKKEIKYLHKKAIKMMRYPGSVSYFEMSNLVKKIRELRGTLLTLMKASVDRVKTLWLRFVHGVM